MSKKIVLNIKNLIGTVVITEKTSLKELQNVISETLVNTIKNAEKLTTE